jgi:hypothetical protein
MTRGGGSDECEQKYVAGCFHKEMRGIIGFRTLLQLSDR